MGLRACLDGLLPLPGVECRFLTCLSLQPSFLIVNCLSQGSYFCPMLVNATVCTKATFESRYWLTTIFPVLALLFLLQRWASV